MTPLDTSTAAVLKLLTRLNRDECYYDAHEMLRALAAERDTLKTELLSLQSMFAFEQQARAVLETAHLALAAERDTLAAELKAAEKLNGSLYRDHNDLLFRVQEQEQQLGLYKRSLEMLCRQEQAE